jgi:DNA polymerase-4
LAAPTCDAEQVTRVALALLEEYAPPRPVRLLGVRVAGLASQGGANEHFKAKAAVGQLELPV